MTPRLAWRLLLGGAAIERPLADAGTTILTAMRLPLRDPVEERRRSGNQLQQTAPATSLETVMLGSDFARVGLRFPSPAIEPDQTFVDGLGVRHLWADGRPVAVDHPLERAGLPEIARHPRPRLPDDVQTADAVAADQGLVTVLDPPAPGLLELCFALRGPWRFLDDVRDDWRAANALLDWSLETVLAAYDHALLALPAPPDAIVYADDLGHRDGLFLEEQAFRAFVQPRLRTLVSGLRRRSRAAVLLHTCGAVEPILGDLAELGIDALNVRADALGLGAEALRRRLPRDLVLHGFTPVAALGAAAAAGDDATVASLVAEFAASWPAVAAPTRTFEPHDAGYVRLGLDVLRAMGPADYQPARHLRLAAI